MPEPILISRWNTLVEDFQIPPKTFYDYVEVALKQRAVPNIGLTRVSLKEGSLFSASREYLRITRDNYIFDVCCAPFGTGCFVSWWLYTEITGCIVRFIVSIPLIGPFIFSWLYPLTYYRLDTAHMFQESVRKAVLQVIDGTTQEKGIRTLTEAERKPIMREFFLR
jgi:hypothetical protein